MKQFLIVLCVTALGLTAMASDKKEKSKTERKPANSAWIYCTAYSVDESIGRIEFGEDSRGVGPYVKVNGNDAELSQLEFTTVKFKVSEKEFNFKFKEGKGLQKLSWGRGDTRVYEISGQTDDKTKYNGICTSYNH